MSGLVEKIGPPKNPSYIHADELADVDAIRFKRAPGLQVRAAGEGPIKLDPKKKSYLWAIDAAGKLRVAPIQKRRDGSESIGHPMLVDGRAARLGGEFLYVEGKRGRGGHWVLNNDSGRYSHFDATVTRKNFEAARRLIEVIGVESTRGGRSRKIDFKLDFRKPNRIERGQSKKDRRKARKGQIMKRLGGYLLRAPKGGGNGARLPRGYRTMKNRLRWAARARSRLGAARGAESWRSRLRSRAASKPRRSYRTRGARHRARSRARVRAKRGRKGPRRARRR